MQMSRERILTTHMGSLPRSELLAGLLIAMDNEEAYDEGAMAAEVERSLAEVVARQAEAGVDIANDGEMPRVGFQTYVSSRMTGFGGEGKRPPPLEMTMFPKWAALIAKRRPARARMYNAPAAIAEVRYEDLAGIETEVAGFRQALAGREDAFAELFMTAASPGIVTTTMMNHHYASHADYLMAVARGLNKEYRYIAEQGFTLQIDAPDLAMERFAFFQDQDLRQFQDSVTLHIEAINTALEGVPAEQARLHVCWGNRDGPHVTDVALAEILPILCRAKVGAMALPFANPRHAHEIDLLKRMPLPDDMLLVVGCIESTSNYVEHPQVVAERIERAVRAMGARERVIAGVDCGFGTFAGYSLVADDVVWAKLQALSEGAAIASKRLWGG
jgi:5-methyltetrahydropteroyltriglutamate--homocysteine methyltransferase